MSEQDKLTEQQQIEDGQRIEAFLNDPVVKKSMDRLKTDYFAEFMKAEGVEQTMLVKAKVKVLEDLTVEFLKVTHAGQVAKIQRDRREKNQRPAGKR